jgi:hypothetical protein
MWSFGSIIFGEDNVSIFKAEMLIKIQKKKRANICALSGIEAHEPGVLADKTHSSDRAVTIISVGVTNRLIWIKVFKKTRKLDASNRG